MVDAESGRGWRSNDGAEKRFLKVEEADESLVPNIEEIREWQIVWVGATLEAPSENVEKCLRVAGAGAERAVE